MRKLRYAVACVLVLASTYAVPAQASPGVVLRENFNNGKLNSWQFIGPGSWSAAQHQLVVDMQSTQPGEFGFAIAGDTNWTNYEYEFDLRGELGGDKLIVFRFRDPDNKYWLNIRALGDIILERHEAGVVSTLVTIPFANVNGVTYHCRIVVNGSRVDLFIDNVQMFSFVDTGSTLTRGKIGFVGYFGGDGPVVNHFDNVVVRLTG